MAGSVTNQKQTLPIPSSTSVSAGSISGTGDTGLDGAEVPYAFLLDANNPGSKVNLLPATLAKVRNLAGTVTSIKASAGTLYGVQVINNQGASAFIQVFNVAAGSVTLGTTTPDLEFQVAANSSLVAQLPSLGCSFGTAISIASTTAEGGNTGSAAGVQVFVQYT